MATQDKQDNQVQMGKQDLLDLRDLLVNEVIRVLRVNKGKGVRTVKLEL
jgi:hypothetical protein